MASNIKKMFENLSFLLNLEEKKKIKIVILIVLTSMFLEIFGISLLVPLILIVYKKSFSNDFEFPEYLNILNNISSEFILSFVFLFFVIKPVILYFFNYYNNKYIFFLKKNLSSRLLDNYFSSSYNKLLVKNLDEIVKNIISSTARCTNGFIGSLINFLSELFVVFGIIILLVIIDPKALFFSLLIIFSIGLIFFSIFKRKLKSYGKLIESGESEMFSVLNYSFSAVKELKIFNLNDLIQEIFEKPNHLLSDLRTKQANIFILPRLIFESIFIIIIVIFFFLLMFNSSLNANILAIAGTFSVAFMRILPSMNRIFNSYNTMIYTSPSIELVSNEMKSFNKFEDNRAIIDLQNFNEFKNISFVSNKTNKKIIDNFSFSFKKNEITCIFGKSGSGKTTVIDIISGLLEPSNFNLKLDGKILSSSFRWSSLGYMGQNNYFINDTFKKNICLYSLEEEFNKTLFDESIRFACLEDLILGYEKKENTIIGYNGVKLSGGELQRLSLARVYYSNKDFLIFDEPTSSLDEKTEEKIIKNFSSMLKNKTIIISSHQLNFKNIANRNFDINNEK